MLVLCWIVTFCIFRTVLTSCACFILGKIIPFCSITEKKNMFKDKNAKQHIVYKEHDYIKYIFIQYIWYLS